MESRAYAAVLVLVGVLLALAGPVVAGGVKATFATAGVGLGGDAASLRRLMMMSARLEDSVAPELTVDLELHRRVLAGVIKPGALNPNRPACIRACPAPGRPYTGRGCKAVYQCPH